jgi:predicted transcriptional regulator
MLEVVILPNIGLLRSNVFTNRLRRMNEKLVAFLSICNIEVQQLKTRSRTDIIGLVLKAAEGKPVTRSKIMYHAMLNFQQVTDYAAFLSVAGLLRYLDEYKQYHITDKGRQFLNLFKEANELLMVADINNNDNYLAANP